MTRKGEGINEVEQLQQRGRRPTYGDLAIRNSRTVRLEDLESRLSVPAVPLSAGIAREESFITDWADS